MDDTPGPRDGALILLKWLVIALTATMLVGMVVLVTLFITRFPEPAAPFPEAINLPEGIRASAVTRGDGWTAVVTEDQRILIYDADSGALRQTVELE